jgi:hypothetical protein
VFQGFNARSLLWNGALGVLGEEGNLFRIALVECDAEVSLAPITHDSISELKPAFALRIGNKLQDLRAVLVNGLMGLRAPSNLVFGSFIYQVRLGQYSKCALAMEIGILCHLNDFLGGDVDVCGNHGSNICKRHSIELTVIAY